MRTLAAGGGAILLCSVIYSGYSSTPVKHTAEEFVVVQEPANVAYNALVAKMPAAGVYPLPSSRSQPRVEMRINARSIDLIDFEMRISNATLMRYQITFHPIDQRSSSIKVAMDVDEDLFRTHFLVDKETPRELLPIAFKYALSKQLKQLGSSIDSGQSVDVFNMRDFELQARIAQREAAVAKLDYADDRHRVKEAQRQASAPMIDARPKAVRPMIDPSRNDYN